MSELRVWAEEIGDGRLRFTWEWHIVEGETDSLAEREAAAVAIAELTGAERVERDELSIVVEIDDSVVARREIARAIREALGADFPTPIDPKQIRVWAEDQDDGSVRMTWQTPNSMGKRDPGGDRRSVAARLSAQTAVLSARTDPEGVVITYDEESIDRPGIAGVVRRALIVEDDLKSRANAMLRRAPAYSKLARTLALDGRVSPIPDAARQMQQSQIGASTSMALRMLPGYMTIRRIQMLLPVIQSLSSWSKDAPPEVVDHHLTSVGLTRDLLQEDYITSIEARLLAQEYAGEKAGQLSQSALSAASKALAASQNWLNQQRKTED